MYTQKWLILFIGFKTIEHFQFSHSKMAAKYGRVGKLGADFQ